MCKHYYHKTHLKGKFQDLPGSITLFPGLCPISSNYSIHVVLVPQTGTLLQYPGFILTVLAGKRYTTRFGYWPQASNGDDENTGPDTWTQWKSGYGLQENVTPAHLPITTRLLAKGYTIPWKIATSAGMPVFLTVKLNDALFVERRIAVLPVISQFFR